MTRLERHRKKQLASRIFLIVVLLFLFTTFMTSFGIPFLVNSSVFIGRLLGGGKADVENRPQELGDIVISDIPQATNSAQIVISGTVENFDSIEFYLNKEKIEEEEIGETGEFSTRIGDLQLGENEIYLVAKRNKNKQKSESQKYTVLYKRDRPKLEITEPQDNFKTLRDEVKVAGKTDKNITIRVNDFPTIVDPNGNFQTVVRLKEGENKIRVTAQDEAGNFEEKTITVIYEKP